MGIASSWLLHIEIHIIVSVWLHKGPKVVLNVVQPNITNYFFSTSPQVVGQRLTCVSLKVFTIIKYVELLACLLVVEMAITLDKSPVHQHDLLV